MKLVHCKLLPSESKTEKSKKFKIIIQQGIRKKRKLLLLECSTQRQKEIWYNTLDTAIKLANGSITKSQTVDEVNSFIWNSSEEEKPDNKDKPLWDEQFQYRTPVRRKNHSEDWRNRTSRVDEIPNKAFHGRYKSGNFIKQKLEEFEPMEIEESQSSDYNKYFFDKFWENPNVAIKYPMSLSLISSREKRSSHDGEHIIENDDAQTGYHNNEEINKPGSFVIERSEKSMNNRSVINEDIHTKHRSSFTIRLGNRLIASEPDPNFMITLSGVKNSVFI